jgi:transcriptional regulator with XRE-family HTH domain
MSIGQNIKRYRKAARLSQNELAARAGINQSNLSRIERENDDSCTVGTLKAVAEVLGCSIMELIGEEKPRRWKGSPPEDISNEALAARIKALEARLKHTEAA